ncbi:MAG: hypothetical protein ACOCUW_03480 [Gemmatimonadota bacterium]
MQMRNSLFLIFVLALATACGGGNPEPATPASQAPGPALVVERFLQAANANDLGTMTDLFGTRDRTIAELDGRQQAEERMYVLASLLRHEDWEIQGQRTVPGRTLDATELMVRLQKENSAPVVPFLVVRRSDGGWIIERIDVEPLTTTG